MKTSTGLTSMLCVAALACGGSSKKDASDASVAPDDADSAKADAEAGDGGPGGSDDWCQPVEALDLLFVIDDSQSMKEEQASLAAALPKLLEGFSKRALPRPDGSVRVLSADHSLHLAVVSSDMGINGAPNLGNCKGFGGDGLFHSGASSSLEGCSGKASDAAYLTFESGTDDPAALAQDVACLTSVGTAGCGFEQQLEAGWKALAPSSNKSFSRGTGGHGDAENKGFLRENSVVAVIQVSDEEDCSIPDSSRELFIATPGEMTLNVKCTRNPDAQHEASRYVNGLRSLRQENQDRVIFGAIVGIPPEAETLVTKDGVTDFDAILALPAMKYAEKDDPIFGRVPAESCATPAGNAYPPRRFVEVAKGFRKNGIIRSICQADLSGALAAITDKIADQLEPACLTAQE